MHFHLISVCRLDPVKGISRVIEAMPVIQSEIPSVHYLVIGAGPELKRLQAMTKELGLNDSVTFLGKIDYSELNHYYNLGDLLIMPSLAEGNLAEGFGIVFLEANACELPVIGSDSGGIASAIVNGVTDIVVRNGDIRGLLEETVGLLKNKKRLASIGKKGRERVLKEANWDNISGALLMDMKRHLE